MSEPKRVVPQCLESPDSLGHATKKEKKREKGDKQLAPSFRFEISLPESNDNSYSEINFAQLVQAAEKKRRKEGQRSHENATNGLHPFDDDDDDVEMLRRKAKYLEAKYGTGTAGRNRHKYDDYVDLGAGYDENDSFIDNTDAYDEIVPGEVTTAYGGFYINSGPLEFKPADGSSPVHSRLNNNNNNNIDDDESSENSGEDEEEETHRITKRLDKRILSSSEDEDDDNPTSGDPPRKKYKTEENGDKKTNSDTIMSKKKKKLPGESTNAPSNQQSEEHVEGATSTQTAVTTMPVAAASSTSMRKNSNDDKREIVDVDVSSEDQEERKKAKFDAAKSSSKGLSAPTDKKYDVNKFAIKVDSSGKRFEKPKTQIGAPSANGLEIKRVDPKKFVGKDSNIDDAIESVVNAGRVEHDESSRDTMDSGKSRCLVGSETENEEIEKEDTLLPEQLSDETRDIVNKLKSIAEKNREGKGKLFDDVFDSALLALEEKLRIMHLPKVRLRTYGHLAHFLTCNKETLVNRGKKLCIRSTESRTRDALNRLKVIIEGMMPSVVEKYSKECQRVAEEKGVDGSPIEIDSSDPESIEKSKIPRKKFPWTSETKKLVNEVACARRHYYLMKRPKKENVESFVASYMEQNVLPIWPGGWVQLQTLLKYSNPEPAEKRKHKKLREGSSIQVNSVSRGESSLTGALTSQEQRSKSPASLGKSESPSRYGRKSRESSIEKKPSSSKNREKNSSSPVTSQEIVVNREPTLSKPIPSTQFPVQKPSKTLAEKFNPMDLTSSSLSITPVNDYQKSGKSPNDLRKDVVSITPYSETTVASSSSTVISATNSNPLGLGVESTQRGNSVSSSGRSEIRQIPAKTDSKSERRVDERSENRESSSHRSEKREKRREKGEHRGNDSEKHGKSHESKKRRKEQQKLAEASMKPEVLVMAGVPSWQISSLTKEEQEQRQIEETMAATNVLSQIINDDLPRGSMNAEKRKESSATAIQIDNEPINQQQQQQQPIEQDNDVQMVMRSLKEIEELREMKYSPSHSPVGSQQKSSKTGGNQYVGYQDDYHHQRIYGKKDEKLRVSKEEASWN